MLSYKLFSPALLLFCLLAMCFSEQHINRIDHNITAGTKLQQHQHKRQSVLKAVHHQAAIRRSRGGNHVAKYSTTTVAEGNIPVITSAARTKPKPVSHRTSCLVDIKFTDHCDDSAIFNTTLVTLNTQQSPFRDVGYSLTCRMEVNHVLARLWHMSLTFPGNSG